MKRFPKCHLWNSYVLVLNKSPSLYLNSNKKWSSDKGRALSESYYLFPWNPTLKIPNVDISWRCWFQFFWINMQKWACFLRIFLRIFNTVFPSSWTILHPANKVPGFQSLHTQKNQNQDLGEIPALPCSVQHYSQEPSVASLNVHWQMSR